MKKVFLAAMTLSLAVSLFNIADAGIRNGMGGGCGDCAQQGASSDPFRKFQADTIDLRQEMMNKRFELQRENLKGTPDREKIASLQAEIRTLQSKILDLRGKSGLPVDKCDGECGKGMGGCNSGPCGGQK
jgi:hypothetical protein